MGNMDQNWTAEEEALTVGDFNAAGFIEVDLSNWALPSDPGNHVQVTDGRRTIGHDDVLRPF